MGALEYADLKATQRTFDNPQELQNLFDAAIQEILVSMHNPNEIENEIERHVWKTEYCKSIIM